MKTLVHISRFLVALTFIFSGFVKLIDPLGSSYKFQEYFSAEVLQLEFLIPYALPFSIFLIVAELMLGVKLLLGYLPKITLWSLLIMILVFLFLTWYSAYYNKVTDCGCFGDAIQLSAWNTFYKNIVLLLLIIFLVFKSDFVKPLMGQKQVKWLAFLIFSMSLYTTYYVLVHLPIIDFRPYAIGKNIPAGMEFIGEEIPPVHDFFLESTTGEDLTDKVLQAKNVMLIVAYNLSASDMQGFVAIKKITDKALKNGREVYLLSSSQNEAFLAIKNKYALNFEQLFCDETTLKTIIRANPGIVTLQNGTVTGKWSWVDASKVK